MTNTVASALEIISGDIYGTRDQFEAVLVDKSINFEREAGFAIQLLSANDYALSTARGNRQSVVDAVTNIAAIGISLNPAKKQAYLVPRDNKICLDISYMGLMDLAMATGSVRWAQAAIVYEADTLVLNGFDRPPEHKYNPFSKDRGAIVGVYVVIKTSDGDYLTHPMAIDDVYAIRDRSSAWKAWIAKKAKSPGPWGSDEGEMIKKTCVKQAYKYWPKTERLETAIHHLNNDSGEGLAELAPVPQLADPGRRLSGGKINAMSGMFEDMPEQRKQVIKAVANAVTDHFNSGDIVGAYEEYWGINSDNDEISFLWKQLPSNVRTALTNHGDSLKAA